MREMKDSGVEWIGEIPRDWEISPVKRFFQSRKRIVGAESDIYDRLALTMDGVIQRSKEDNEGLQPEKFEGYQILRENELVLKLIDLENVKTSRVGLSRFSGLVSPAYIVISGKYKDNRFFYYWFISMYYNEVFNHLGGEGVRSALNVSDVLCLPTVLIPEPLMLHIANYLDAQCARIDRAIARQQEVIEKLKEYKLAVITEAVTKGLNPNVPMKDSGIEWIGEIPEGWKIVKLKFLLTHIIDCPHETPNYNPDGEYLVIRTADQDYGYLRSDDSMYRLDQEEYNNRTRRLPLVENDIVYGREGERWGLACLVPETGKYCLGQRMMQFRCEATAMLPFFAMWALNSRNVYLQGMIDTFGSTSPHVNISTIRNYSIPTPPLSEQRELVDYLEKFGSALELKIRMKQNLIDKLTQYKKSLIYEVVTGKREV